MTRAAVADFRVEPLARRHDRAAFVCGVEDLDAYLKTRASQDMRRKANAVFVMVPASHQPALPGTSRSALTH